MAKSTAITKRLLLIDDDEDLREIFYVTLSSTLAGIELLLAESGEMGLAIASLPCYVRVALPYPFKLKTVISTKMIDMNKVGAGLAKSLEYPAIRLKSKPALSQAINADLLL